MFRIDNALIEQVKSEITRTPSTSVYTDEQEIEMRLIDNAFLLNIEFDFQISKQGEFFVLAGFQNEPVEIAIKRLLILNTALDIITSNILVGGAKASEEITLGQAGYRYTQSATLVTQAYADLKERRDYILALLRRHLSDDSFSIDLIEAAEERYGFRD